MSTTTSSSVSGQVSPNGSGNGVPAIAVSPGRPAGRRRRRPALIGLAIVLIVGSAAVAGLLALRLDTRSPALVATRAIAIGQQITQDDLGEQRIAGDGLTVLGADQASRVVGSYATQDIPQGRLIDAQMVQTQGFLKAGTVAVGVVVPPGRMPASGLKAGDRVQVVQVADGVATVLVDEAVVSSGPTQDQSSGGSGGLLGGSISGSDTGTSSVATLIVSPTDAPKIAAASAANRIAVVLITRGEALNSK